MRIGHVVNKVKVVAVGACALALAGSGNATSPPAYIELLGIIRDFPPESHHPDFLVNPSNTGRSAKNIALLLDADKKPAYVGGGKRVNTEFRDAAGNKIAWCAPLAAGDQAGNFSSHDNGGIQSATTFAQWFRDVLGVNMSRSWSIRLDRQSDGMYVFDTANFNPIDYQLLGNGPDEHNFYFTYEIVCSFTSAPGQFISFTGDDDCWIFVDNRLAIDHGGIASNRRQCFTLDRLGLTTGQQYELRFFFAERCQPQSQFRIETNIGDLRSQSSVSALAACD